MVQYRRNLVAGATYFFTVTLADRRSHLLTQYVDVLRESVKKVQQQHPFEIVAWVVLPDHLHAVWTLPKDDSDYSVRWRAIKSHFVRSIKKHGVAITMRADSSAKCWQRRFWEHTIKNEDDLRRCVDYCYINPVKHGLVKVVVDWPYSSFHRDVKRGIYPSNWASGDGDESGYGEP
ncbi:MAG: transposase [Methylotenera sp.]|nr:transposase [Methylotenera sp.]